MGKSILFWSTYNQESNINFHAWRNREITLSPFHELSLFSHEKFDRVTVLYTYQKINRSSQINIKDANEIFPAKDAYNALRNGHSIAHISDAVRLKYASKYYGTVIDMDAVLLKPLPNHLFMSSMPAKMTGGFAPKWGDRHPPLAIHDGSWDGKALGAFPINVEESISSEINNLSDKIIQTLAQVPSSSSTSLSWNYVIWTLKEIARSNTDMQVYQPISFCPLPAWLAAGKCYSLETPTRLDGKTELFGYTLPSIDKILNESFVVQHFFESAFQKVKQVDKNFWSNISEDCLVAKEAYKIIGIGWRGLLRNWAKEPSMGIFD